MKRFRQSEGRGVVVKGGVLIFVLAPVMRIVLVLVTPFVEMGIVARMMMVSTKKGLHSMQPFWVGYSFGFFSPTIHLLLIDSSKRPDS